MSTSNCVVTRSFRGAELFLASVENQGFVWSADRANALRMELGEALKTVKRFESWISGDPDPGIVRVLDPKGQVLSTGRLVNRVFASKAEMRRHDANMRAREAYCTAPDRKNCPCVLPPSGLVYADHTRCMFCERVLK